MDTLARVALLKRAQDFAQQSFNILHRMDDEVGAGMLYQKVALTQVINHLDLVARRMQEPERPPKRAAVPAYAPGVSWPVDHAEGE